MENVVFGSGHMVNDLLSAFKNELPKLLLVGDPYQLSRGDLELNLLSCQTLREKGLHVEDVLLDQQIESEPKELHDFRFEIAQHMQQKYFNKLPIANNDIVSKVENDSNIGKDITSSRFYAVYLTALNDVAQKINFAAKQKILQQANPYVLNNGDIIDFHTSCPIITSDTDDINPNNNWIHSGEIATVTSVDAKIDTIEMTLKGRNAPTSLQIGYLNCRLPKLDNVKLSYIIDYLHADKPELSIDQILVLNIRAREEAASTFKDLKAKLDNFNKKDSEEYKSEKMKYEELVQKHILNSPLLNAARIRYAYAMTVHRAQGREWSTVYLDASRSSSGDSITNDGYFRFLYTASMCTKKRLKLLKYPTLTPLYQTQFIPNKNCQICSMTLNRGFNYTFPNAAEFENFNYPIGMNTDVQELKAIYFCVAQLLINSPWKISELKQYSYQELYTFENTTGKKVQVRFTYDKSIKVKNLTFLDDSVETTLKEELRALLINDIVFDDSKLNIALVTIRNFVEALGFEIVDAKSSGEWEFQVLCAKNSEAIQLKIWVIKTGLISKIMPEKATTKEVVELFKESLNGK